MPAKTTGMRQSVAWSLRTMVDEILTPEAHAFVETQQRQFAAQSGSAEGEAR